MLYPDTHRPLRASILRFCRTSAWESAAAGFIQHPKPPPLHPSLFLYPIPPWIAARRKLDFKMISGVLIFNQKGENLIFRAFRNECRPRLADVFRIQVISNAQVRSPILTLGSTTFSHVKHENIYLVAITKSNANAALVLEFLYRLIQLGKGYFGKFDEEAVKNNFVLVYELLDGKIFPGPFSFFIFSSHLLLAPTALASPADSVRHLQRSSTSATRKTPRRTPSRCTLQRKASSRSHGQKKHPRLRCKLLAPYHGEKPMSGIGKMRLSWMSLKTSTFSCRPRELYCVLM